MNQTNNIHKDKIVSILRKQAEKLLEGNNASVKQNLSNEEINVLLNELQIFQLELEMQNDELKASYQALYTERAKFESLFDLAPVGYFILDYIGIIEDANQTGVDLLDTLKERILYKRFQSFIAPDAYESFFSFLHKMQNSDEKQTMEIRLKLANGQVISTRMEGKAISHIITKSVKYYITAIDITESRYAQQVLQETTERLEMTLKASSTGTWTVDPITGKIYLDDFSYDILGIKSWEFDGSRKGFIELIDAEDQPKVMEILTSRINDSTEIDIEFKLPAKDGKIKRISAKGHGIADPEDKKYFAGILMDITERKKLALEAENLRTDQHRVVLSATLTAQEKEREKISSTLHDSICQILYGIRLHLQNIQLSNNLKGVFKNINQLLDQAIRETRQISYELTPSVLKDFGFNAGIKEMAQRFSTPQFRIKTDIGNDADKLPPNFQLYIFRIIQELINNCIKHSGANEAKIKVSLYNDFVTLMVSDNGTGFDQNMEPASKSGSGLRGIKNRIFLLDGEMDFHSAVSGTTITISFKNNLNLSGIENANIN